MIPLEKPLLKKKIKKSEKSKLLRKKSLIKDIVKDEEIVSNGGNFTESPLDDKQNTSDEQSASVENSFVESDAGTVVKSKKKKKNKLAKRVDYNDDADTNENSQKNVNKTSDKKENVVNQNKKDRLPERQLGLNVLSNASFSVLKGKVSDETLKAIEEMGFTQMTEIQAKAIPPLLEGKDVVGNAKTGSGKTLAFLIPAIEMIVKLKFEPSTGTGCIIISPTRELAMQTFGVLQQLMKYHENTYGVIMGGAKWRNEVKKLNNGVNILVVTPGRLIGHLQNTPNFITKNLKCLIIDEADRLSDPGFKAQMKQIVDLLPKKRRLTMLFSASSTWETEDLSLLGVKTEPVYVGIHDSLEIASVDGLEPSYIVCPPEKRFLLLTAFLKKNYKEKIIVFFSSWRSVDYHDKVFNNFGLPVMSIHGKQEQQKRTTTYFKYCSAETGILLCTDMAARGLDIPAVDWIVQYDPPDDPKEYIRRVCRTARAERRCRAILLLRPEERSFLHYLEQAKFPLNEFEYNWKEVPDIQSKLETLIDSNYDLKRAAESAFKSCVCSYNSHHLKEFFDINTLDLTKLAKTFGLTVPCVVHNLKNSKATSPQKRNRGDDGQDNTDEALQVSSPKKKIRRVKDKTPNKTIK